MNAALTLLASDVFLRITAKDGAVAIVTHRVWDRERFLENTRKAHEKEGSKVEVVDRATFEAARKRP